MNTEREAFEAYQNSIGASTSKNKDGKYFSETANAAWIGWQAALANKPEAEPVDFCKTCPNSRNVVCAYCEDSGLTEDSDGNIHHCPQKCPIPDEATVFNIKEKKLYGRYVSYVSSIQQLSVGDKLYTAALQKRIEELEALNRSHEEVNADHNRLVRELDIALHGIDGAAPQASLCDILAMVKAGDVQAPKEEWKLVPIEPTNDMKKLGWNAYRDSNKPAPYNALNDAYKAMIAAAPTDTEGK